MFIILVVLTPGTTFNMKTNCKPLPSLHFKYSTFRKSFSVIGKVIIMLILLNATSDLYCNIPGGKRALKAFRFYNESQLCKIVNNELKTFTLLDSYEIFQFKDFTVYQIQTENITPNYTDNKSPEIKYYHFVFKNSDQTGKIYDPSRKLNGKEYAVKDFLNDYKFSFNELQFESNDNYSLVKQEYSANSIVLKEIYLIKNKYDESFPDSVYHIYSKDLMDCNFTFSKKSDSLKNSKLCEARYIFNPFLEKGRTIELPKHEYIFGIKKIDAVNKNEIYNLIKRYKKDLRSSLLIK
jgi:hypothetical protein